MIKNYIENFATLLKQEINLELQNIIKLIEIPPENISWDLAFPCFVLSKILKKSPNIIAKELAEKLGKSTEAIGPYINIHIDNAILAKEVITTVLTEKENFWRWKTKSKTILIESPGPNTNKPLHLWHVRNLLLGNAIEEILKFYGFDTKRVDIINDRGIHICKSMLAYKKFGNNQKPNKKTDHFVGDRYVEYNKQLKNHPELEKETKQMLIDRENEEPETRTLRKKMNKRALEWIAQTYKRYWTTIQKAYFESEYYLKGKQKVLEEFKKWTFKKNETRWDIVFSSQNNHRGEKTVLRSDGTSIYSTNDIWVIQGRYEDFKMDKMIYVVWSEQEDYFKVLFEIFQAIGYPFAKNCHHLSYGMISLTTWKMKSREGTVVDADNLANKMHKEAKILLQERFPDLQTDELEYRAEAIAMSAIKFYIIKYDVNKNFIFDPKDSLKFDGETWPYLQYTYARTCSIINKINNWKQQKTNINNLDFELLTNNEEKNLLLKIAEFHQTIKKSANDYKPNNIARFTLELAKLFNNYYQKHKISQENKINKPLEEVRLSLVNSIKIVLKTSLNLLGIKALEMM